MAKNILNNTIMKTRIYLSRMLYGASDELPLSMRSASDGTRWQPAGKLLRIVAMLCLLFSLGVGNACAETITANSIIYVDVTNFSATYNSGYFFSVSGNGSTTATKDNTSGAASYQPKKDTWYTLSQVSGSLYAAKVTTANTNGRVSFWSKNESSYDNVWEVNVSLGQSYDSSKRKFTISSGYTTHSDRKACCFNCTTSAINLMQGGTTLYLKANSNWIADGARFAACFLGQSGQTWVSFTLVEGYYYKCTVPTTGSGEWPYVIICRMNGGNQTNSWSNVWNQTEDFAAPAGTENCIVLPSTITTGCSWRKYTEGYAIVGEMNDWMPMANMMSGASTTKTVSMTLDANKSYAFKVADGYDDNWWGYSDTDYKLTYAGQSTSYELLQSTGHNMLLFTTTTSGTYTFTWNTSTQELSVTYPAVTHPSSDYIYFLNNQGWDPVAGHAFNGSSGNTTVWGFNPALGSFNFDGTTYYYMATGDHTGAIFGQGIDDSHKTADLTVSAGRAKYYNKTNTSWNNFTATLTLSTSQGETTNPSPTSITVTYNATTNINTDVISTSPAKTGYAFGGYYTNVAGGGTQIITTSEKIPSALAGYTSSGKWIKTGTSVSSTLYAKWTQDITLNQNSATTNGSTSLAATYNATLSTAGITNPSRTGYTFAGWATTANGTVVINPNGTVNTVADWTDGSKKWIHAGASTLYAKWTVNPYRVDVASVAHATISATTPSIAEGGNANANYGSTVTLSGTADAGYAFAWDVYKYGDTSTKVTVTNNQFTMPEYRVVVSAVLYSDLKAWCVPDVTITGDVHMTSYSGVDVRLSKDLDDLININCTYLGSATKIAIKFLDGNDVEYANNSLSRFRLCNNGTSPENYNVMDQVNGSGPDTILNVSDSTQFRHSYSLKYQPANSTYGQLDNGKLKLVFMKGTHILGTATHALHGRSLPEYFVIAVKNGDQWVALPNNLAATEGAQGAISPIEITVDNTTTPTAATWAPSTTAYRAREKGNTNKAQHAHVNTLRFATTGSNYLQVSSTSSTYKMWLSGTSSANVQDWHLKSSDFNSYELTIPATSATKKLGLYNYGKNIGYHTSPSASDIYILPVTNWLTPNEAYVTEWGQNSVILEVDPGSAASAQAHFGNRASAEEVTSFSQTRTGSTYNRTLTFSTTDFSTHKGDVLYIDWLDGSSNVLSTSTFHVPWIIASSDAMYTKDANKDHWNTEVHVLPGVTLTANAGSFTDEAVDISDLHIYPGATVSVTTGSLNVSQDLVLRNGWTYIGGKSYGVAQLYISSDATVGKPTNTYADWYIDYDQYYSIAVPWTVTTNGMSYLNSSSAASAGVKMRYYDGQSRADGTGSASSGANWTAYSRTVEATTYAYPETLTPGVGYAMTAKRPSGKAVSIIRMPLTIPSLYWLKNGEKGVVNTTHKDQVSVVAYEKSEGETPEYAKGWNFVGNPYMSLYKGKLSYAADDDIEYANIPDVNFKEFDQVPINGSTKLKPFSAFLIQAPKDGTLTFASSSRVASAPALRKEGEATSIPTQKAYVLLSNDSTEDMMGILVADKYTEAYESNADLQKLLGDGTSLKTYMHYGDLEMAYLAVNENLAKEWIPVSVRIPENGEYTFSMHDASIAGELEGVYLIDYANGDKITNLIESNYTFTAEAGTNSSRFAINAIVGERTTPTDIDVINEGGELDANKPVKFIYHDKVYIYCRGVIYDSTGKRIKEINK